MMKFPIDITKAIQNEADMMDKATSITIRADETPSTTMIRRNSTSRKHSVLFLDNSAKCQPQEPQVKKVVEEVDLPIQKNQGCCNIL